MTADERLVMFDEVKRILKGIDHTQGDTHYGWWETSTGADFGWGKLEELKELILTEKEK